MEYAQAALPAVPIFQDLYLCTAGKSVCRPGHEFGPDVRLNYLIHYILSGKGVFETDEVQYNLCEGQGFLIEPGHTTRYQADSKEPWTYIWVGFNGSLAPTILNSLKLNRHHPIFACPASSELELIADKLLLPASFDAQLSLNQQSLLISFFSVLADHPPFYGTLSASDTRANYHIERALTFIRSNYSKKIQVVDVARHLGISRFHLHNLFVQVMNQTPQEYITGFCLGQAREFLTTTDYPISEIAQLCGYSGGDVFAKAFKKKYLASPSKYRQYALEHPGHNPSEYIAGEASKGAYYETDNADYFS